MFGSSGSSGLSRSWLTLTSRIAPTQAQARKRTESDEGQPQLGLEQVAVVLCGRQELGQHETSGLSVGPAAVQVVELADVRAGMKLSGSQG